MKRKITSVILSVLLIIITFMPVMKADYQSDKRDMQNKINEANDKKNEVASEKKDALSEISDLEDSIAKYETELDSLQDDIKKTEKEIKSKNAEIEKLQKDFEKKQQLLEDKLVAIYEEGQITFLDVILSSDNILDYISMGTRLQEMTEADNKQMEEVENQRLEVEKAKNQLEENKTKLDNQKKSAEAKQAQLKVVKASKQTKVANLNAEEKKIQSQIEEYNAKIKEIDKKIREQANKASNIYNGSFSGTLGWPLSNSSRNYNLITSGFGSRTSPVAGASSNHRGIDIGVSTGTPVYASADGYVISVQHSSVRGIFVLIKHANDLYTRYQHLNSSAVSNGQYVKRGQLIAYSGNTGIGSGAHLHFEVLTTPYYMSEINPLTCGLVSVPNLRYY